MHQPIREGLEAWLSGATGLPESFSDHLKACGECAGELDAMRGQARLLGSLRARREPRPGFYARVIDRIEQQVRPSIWALMLEPVFGRSIAVACAVLTLVLGTYLITTEPGDSKPHSASIVATEEFAPSPAVSATAQDRDAVLVNLASFRTN